MEYNDVESLRAYDFTDLNVCDFCIHFAGISSTCGNRDSPLYDTLGRKEEFAGIGLNSLETFFGCVGLDYNGEKMPIHIFRTFPGGSILRKISPSSIIKDYNSSMEISPYYTIDGLFSLLEIFEKFKKRIAHRVEKGKERSGLLCFCFVDGNAVFYNPVERKIIKVFNRKL